MGRTAKKFKNYKDQWSFTSVSIDTQYTRASLFDPKRFAYNYFCSTHFFHLEIEHVVMYKKYGGKRLAKSSRTVDM